MNLTLKEKKNLIGKILFKLNKLIYICRLDQNYKNQIKDLGYLHRTQINELQSPAKNSVIKSDKYSNPNSNNVSPSKIY
jgi:hypothetical protein